MKLNKRILAFVLTLAMAFNMAIPAFAAPASSEAAEAAPGEQVTLEFVYENVVNGFEGSIEFSNPDLVLSIDDIVITGLSEKALVEFSSNKQKFFILSSTIDNVVYPLVTVKVTLTIKEDAVVGENLTVSLNYVYANDPDDIYGSETDGKDDSDIVIIPDYTKLKEAIAEAETYLPNKDEYEVGKWAAFETALAEAKEALNATTQGEVDTATATLRAAMNALTAPDLSALYEQILDANSKIEKQYTKASWQNLQTVLAEATNVYNTSKDQNEINQMTETLKAAIAALVAAPDRTLLLEQIARAEALNKLDYTTETWEGKDVDGKLATAKGLVESDDAEAINAAANALKVALDGLKSPVTTGLETQLSAAAGITDIGYTASSWDKFVEKYAAAQKVYDDVIAKTERSQTAINTAANALENAIAELDTLEREALEDKIFIAKVRLNGLYTVASKDALRLVLEDAEDVYENARTQEAIDEAVEKLDAAIKALVALPNYEELEKQIAAAEDLINAGKEMENTIQSWAEMMDAYNNAKDVLQRLEEDASVVNSAAAALRDAITMLSAPDYSAITNLLAEIAGLTETDYTPSTWQALMQEVAEANEVIANVDNHTLRDQDAINAAADELRAAKNGLKGAIDYDELVKQITIANGKLNGSIVYTPATLAALNAALDAAKAANNVCEDQTEVDSLAAALADAIAKLVEFVDYTALTNKIAEAEALDENLFTEESWTKLENAIAKAKPALNATTQAAVNKAVEDLDKAIGALVNPDYSALIDAIGKVPADETIYTQDSWDLVANALANAKALLNVGRDQTKINSAAQKLEDAIIALVLMNYIELNNQIGAADAIMPDEMDYTEDSWNEFKTAYDAAVAAKTSRDQLTVDNAATALKDAIATLVKINREALNNAINSVPTDEDTYTTESWADLQNALNAAIAAKTSRDQDEIDNATANLRVAILELVDVTFLKSAIAEAESKKTDGKIYTDESFNDMLEYLGKTDAVLISGTQNNVDEIAASLMNAISELKEMDYTALEDVINSAPTNEDSYTEKSWESFEILLNQANDALSSRDQKVVDDAAIDLKLAISELVDVTNLKAAIASGEDKNTDGKIYSDESLKRVNEALEKAKAALKDGTKESVAEIAATLMNAISELHEMNYADLQNAIQRAPANANKDSYTENSWTAFEPALNDANNALSSRDQKVVDEAAIALNKAIDALVDITALRDLIDEAEAKLHEAIYSDTTRIALEVAIDEAEAELKSGSNESVQSAIDAIKTAMSNLHVMDYSKLTEAIDKANGLTETDYTTDSWTALKNALDAAVAAKDVKDQDKVDEAVDALNKAIDALVDITALRDLIDEAEAKLHEAIYSDTTRIALEVAIDEAEAEFKSGSNESVQSAIDAIKTAMSNLHVMDYSKLTEAIDKANGLTETDYTTDSWTALKNALDAAVAAKDVKDQDKVDEATDALNKAIDALVDITALRDLIDEAEAKLHEAIYSDTTRIALEVAIDEAEAELKSGSNESVQSAIDAIKTAMSNLHVMDYSKLTEAIDKANGLKETDYTTDSWTALKNALDAAVAAKDVKDQDKVDEATDALNAAIDARVPAGLAELLEMIEEAKKFDGKDADYTTDSWTLFGDAKAAAEALVDSKNNAEIVNATAKLNEKMSALVPVGREALEQAIKSAIELEKQIDVWTTESIAALAAARANGEAVVNGLDNNAIVAATKAINEAIDKLDPLTDAAELIKQITIAKAINGDIYTEKSWNAFLEVLANAEYVRDNYKTQDEIDAAKDALILAMKEEKDGGKLVKMDYTELNIQIGKAPATTDELIYSEESWNKMIEALEAANAVKTSRDQAVVDAAAKALKEAIAALHKMNYDELNSQITAAGKLNKDLYTESTWAKVESALAAAEAVKTSRDQAVVDAAAKALKDAIAALTEMNYTELLEQIEAAGKLNKDLYTESTWAKVESALAAAEAAKTSRDQAVVDAATKALKDAIAALVLMDYDDLAEIIERAQALTESKYTDKSWKVLEEALEAAIAAQSSHDQSVVNAAANALAEAIENLVPMNLDALIEQIEAAEKLIASEYTSASWADLEIAFEAAKEALTSTNQLTVNEAAEALAEAIADLVKMDYSKLTQVIESTGALNKELYTAESWAALEEALAEAEKAYEYRVQADVDAAVKALEDAIAALEFIETPDVDTSALAELIARAEALDGEKYTAETWAALQSALANAKTALKSDSQQVIDDAAKALSDAIAALKEKEIEPPKPTVDYTELNKAIEAAGKLNKDKWTEASWAVLEAKLADAKAALTSTEQSVVDAAAKALNDAIAALEEKQIDPPKPTVDYTELLEQIEAAEKLNKDEWTDATWAELTSKLEAGKAALTSTEQSVVDAAAKAIKDAIAALETKPAEPTVDYTELLEQIARTEGLKEADYTAATWKTMSDALASANAALNSTEQSVVDAATEALKNAIDALEKAPVKPDPQPDPEPEFPWVLFIIIIIVVALTGAAVVVVIILKKKGIIKL